MTTAAQTNLQAWEAVIAFVDSRRDLATDAPVYQWRRENAYDERESRFQRAVNREYRAD